jgi:hypothetical protein
MYLVYSRLLNLTPRDLIKKHMRADLEMGIQTDRQTEEQI